MASKAVILTSDEAVALVKEKDSKNKEKEEKAKELAARREAKKGAGKDAGATAGPKQKKRKKKNDDSETSSEEDEEGGPEKPWVSDNEGSEKALEKKQTYDHGKLLEAMDEIRKEIDDKDRGSFYAVFYEKKYYWGRVEVVEANEPKAYCSQVRFETQPPPPSLSLPPFLRLTLCSLSCINLVLNFLIKSSLISVESVELVLRSIRASEHYSLSNYSNSGAVQVSGSQGGPHVE